MIEDKSEDLTPGTPPTLSPALLITYNSLPENDKKTFILMFRYLWGCVAPARRFTGFGGVLHTFWAVELLRSRLTLSPWDLSILTYLYQVTNKGRKFIKSKNLYSNYNLFGTSLTFLRCRLSFLRGAGYVLRANTDPNYKYFAPKTRQKQYINLTPTGVRLIEGMEHDLYKILVDRCLTDITHTKKKPHLNNINGA